jgi:hypothetical protein
MSDDRSRDRAIALLEREALAALVCGEHAEAHEYLVAARILASNDNANWDRLHKLVRELDNA